MESSRSVGATRHAGSATLLGRKLVRVALESSVLLADKWLEGSYCGKLVEHSITEIDYWVGTHTVLGGNIKRSKLPMGLIGRAYAARSFCTRMAWVLRSGLRVRLRF